MNLQKDYKGIILATVIGLVGYFGAAYLPSSVGSILVALLLGIIAGNLIKIPDNFQSGIGFTSSRLLEFSILFLAFSINYTHISRLGIGSFSILLVVVISLLLLTYFLALRMKCPSSTGWLIGFGTTICGSSAIAALSPSVTKNKDDVGIAMAVVNLYGSLGMILMPLILTNIGISDTQISLLIGGSLHSVGNVAGAGYSVSNEVGEMSITIKLARVALLSPALIFFNFLVNRNNVKNWKQHFNLPWYLWSFIGITIFTSIVQLPEELLKQLETVGKIVLTIAMAAIGLKISFKKLFQSGRQGLTFGLIIFAIQLIMLSLLMFLV